MIPHDENLADQFESLRPALKRLAYRMLGSVTEAEDIVQDAYIRWHLIDQTTVRTPSAYLARTVTRLCLNHLKSARVRRETYVGTWLPEPMLTSEEQEEEALSHDVSYGLIIVLQSLSPLERAAFLLHDVFGVSFDEIARSLDKHPAACRQMASRARRRVREARPRFKIDPVEGQQIATAFFDASRSGDVDTLRALLAESVVTYTDGGGVKIATLRPLEGIRRTAGFFVGMARKASFTRPPVLFWGKFNGLPGFATIEKGGVVQTTALQIENGKILAIYIVRNPDKIGHLFDPVGDRVH